MTDAIRRLFVRDDDTALDIELPEGWWVSHASRNDESSSDPHSWDVTIKADHGAYGQCRTARGETLYAALADAARQAHDLDVAEASR